MPGCLGSLFGCQVAFLILLYNTKHLIHLFIAHLHKPIKGKGLPQPILLFLVPMLLCGTFVIYKVSYIVTPPSSFSSHAPFFKRVPRCYCASPPFIFCAIYMSCAIPFLLMKVTQSVIQHAILNLNSYIFM